MCATSKTRVGYTEWSRLLLKSLVHTVPVYARYVPAVYSRWTWKNREGIRVRSYIPGSATDQTRFGAKMVMVCPGYATVYDGAFPV